MASFFIPDPDGVAVSGMGDVSCDFCGVTRPADRLVPVQRRDDARACRDCAILMETEPDSFVVRASGRHRAPSAPEVPDRIGQALRGAPSPPGPGDPRA